MISFLHLVWGGAGGVLHVLPPIFLIPYNSLWGVVFFYPPIPPPQSPTPSSSPPPLGVGVKSNVAFLTNVGE